MDNIPLLSILTFLPLIGAGFIFLVARGDDDALVAQNSRTVALWTTVATFVLSLALWFGFDRDTADFQFVETAPWFADGITYTMGVDGISVLFILLTTILMPLCILASWDSVKKRVKEYMIAFLIMETLMIGVFCALDAVLFYLFFEASLIPMFLIIGIWGGARRIYASFKFFLYTLLGSVFMLLALLYMYYDAGTMSIPDLITHGQTGGFDAQEQFWLFLALLAAFAVKVPMWPVHTWLPDAHVEAPTAGSVILAGVLLKLGAYGMLRFQIPMLPIASVDFAPFIYALSCIAVIYTSLVALMQEDMKKLIAYSSVAHMAFITIGIFTFTMQGLQGGIFQMLSHGVVSGALFLCVGVIYDRMHTREIARYGGLVERMPKYAIIFLFFTMATIGLPGTSGFVGEFLIITGAFQDNTLVAALAFTGVILGAAYSLWLYRRVVFGKLTRDDLKSILDMDRREVLTFAPLVVLALWMGIYPQPFLDVMAASLDSLLIEHQAALELFNEAASQTAATAIVAPE